MVVNGDMVHRSSSNRFHCETVIVNAVCLSSRIYAVQSDFFILDSAM